MRTSVPGLRSPHPLVPSLPGLLQDDPLTVELVAALDEVLAPVPVTLDNLDAYLAPATAPEDWLRWLAEWVGLPGEAFPDVSELRTQVAAAAAEQSTTGTLARLERVLQDSFGKGVRISDTGATRWSTTPNAPLPGTDEARVSVKVSARVDQDAVRIVAQAQVPPYVLVEVTR